MKKNQFFSSFFLSALLLTLFTSCKKEDIVEPRDEVAVVNDADSRLAGGITEKKLETDLLKAVRSATARFHSTKQAIAAGYVADEHCVSVPGLGGMGYHWLNLGLVDPVFDPLKPEALLYATGPGGNLRLIGVEYLIVNAGQPRPMFGNKLFDVRGAPVPFDHWTLHVWVHEENPSGIFAPFNPNISCP